MKGKPGRPRPAWSAAAVLALAAGAAACSSNPPASTRAAVPAEFRPACGHPGAKITVTRLPVTIPHRACDLTRVLITVPGRGGMVVPDSPGGVGNSAGLTLTVDNRTLDVTLTATGPAGNA
jgi:hypothetical protein